MPPTSPEPTLALAGAERCHASPAVQIGLNHSRRPERASPQLRSWGEPALSNLQLARIGPNLVAAWPWFDDTLTIQALTDTLEPAGEQQQVSGERAFTLFALTPHGGDEPLALLQTVHQCKERGRRCLDSWWIDAEGRSTGELTQEYLSEGMVGNKSNVIDLALLRPVPAGVLFGRSYDSTRNGYAYLGCSLPNRAPVDPCPVTMHPPILRLYEVGSAGEVVVETVVEVASEAARDVMLPIASSKRTGALHFRKDIRARHRTWLRWADAKPVRLRGLEVDFLSEALQVHVDEDAGVLEVVHLREGGSERLRFGLDGSRLGDEGNTAIELERVYAQITADFYGNIKLVRALGPGQRVGEDLTLATTERDLRRIGSMRGVVWDGDRFVVIYGLPVDKLEWAVMVQRVDCSPAQPGQGSASPQR